MWHNQTWYYSSSRRGAATLSQLCASLTCTPAINTKAFVHCVLMHCQFLCHNSLYLCIIPWKCRVWGEKYMWSIILQVLYKVCRTFWDLYTGILNVNGKTGNGDPTLDIWTNWVANSLLVPISWGASVLMYESFHKLFFWWNSWD